MNKLQVPLLPTEHQGEPLGWLPMTVGCLCCHQSQQNDLLPKLVPSRCLFPNQRVRSTDWLAKPCPSACFLAARESGNLTFLDSALMKPDRSYPVTSPSVCDLKSLTLLPDLCYQAPEYFSLWNSIVYFTDTGNTKVSIFLLLWVMPKSVS